MSKRRKKKKDNYMYNGMTGFPQQGVTRTCKHWRVPIKMGAYVVYASSEYECDEKSLKIKPIPEVGVYLDTRWINRLVWFTAVGMMSPTKWEWPFVVADWPDMGVLPDGEMDILMKLTLKHIKAGKRVEIACIGGHGRTGTMLAMLRVELDNMTAKEAIESIRSDYCKETVESTNQIKAVYRYAGENEDNAKEVSPAKTYSYGTVGYEDCAECDHTEYPHIRAEKDFGKVGCAYTKFNDKDPWKCVCKGFIPKPQEDKETLSEWLDGLDRKDWYEHNEDDGSETNMGAGDDLFAMLPDDVCHCMDRYKHHDEESNYACSKCTCPAFELFEMVVEEGGVTSD